MKVWQKLICWKLALLAGNAWAEEPNTTTQLNRMRSLQNQISQGLAEMAESGPKSTPWTASLGSGMTYTTNAHLTSGGAKGDFYATNVLGARRQSELGSGFAFSSGLDITDFRYFRYPKLSISFLDWDLMLNWSGTRSGFDLQGYFSHTLEWTQQRTFQTQTFSNILALGGSVSRKIRPGHELSAAAELSATPYTSPSANAYACASISTSYDWTIVSGISLKMSLLGYETLYFTGARDFTTTCSATVTWAITSWLSASAFASPTWNSSTTKGSSYSVVDTGVNVAGTWKF